MSLIKCPRCELNYIREDDRFCSVCMRELKGEQTKEDVELCSICNEAPVLTGRDVCMICLREMSGSVLNVNADMDGTEDDVGIDMDPAGPMDEIISDMNDSIPEREFGEIESELSSLESIREGEEIDEDNEEDDEF